MNPQTIFRLPTGVFFGLAVTCIASAMFGKWRLWVLTFAAMWFLLAIQGLSLRRAIKRQMQAEREWMERALPELEQAVEDCERMMRAAAPKRNPDAATRDALRLLQDEIAQAQREAVD